MYSAPLWNCRKTEAPMDENLDLEVIEVEFNGKPGCLNSSSTSPRCTCPVAVDPPVEAEQK